MPIFYFECFQAQHITEAVKAICVQINKTNNQYDIIDIPIPNQTF